MLGVMPKTTGGKKWLKRIVFGNMVKMPAEIGPQISQITQIAQNEKDEKTPNGAPYVEPDRIPSDVANTSHKVIYCAATLDSQITPVPSIGATGP